MSAITAALSTVSQAGRFNTGFLKQEQFLALLAG